MAQIETFNFDETRRKIPGPVLADSMRAIAEFLEAEGRLGLAREFVAESGFRIEPLTVAPAVLDAACAFCERQGEPGIAAQLRDRFLIRE
jgi:hypothetical protein